MAQFSYFAPPTYAANEKPTKSVISVFKNTVADICSRIVPQCRSPVVSPVPLPQDVLGEETTPITTQAQALNLTDLELRIASLENQLISSSPSVVSSSFSTGANLIRNSSFESANDKKPRQWSYIYDSTSSNTIQTEEGIRSGNYGLKFSGATSGGHGLDLGISQPETETTPQRTYTLSLYVKHTNVNNDTDVRNPDPTTAATTSDTHIRLGFWDKYNNKFGPMKTIAISGTKDWYRLSTTVTTTGTITDYANWYPMIEVRGLKDGAAVYIDDVQLEEGSVLTVYNTAQASGGTFGGALGDGSILATTTGTLYPAEDGIGSLGTTSNRWNALYLSKASIDDGGNLSLDGSTTVGSNLTVNNLATFVGGISVGSNGGFAINSSGDITKIKGVAYSFPSAQGATSSVLMNDGTGALAWGTFGAASVTPDSLDFAQFMDAMTMDADSSINLYNGTPTDLRFYNSNSGSEMLFLNGSTGYLGIGTTAPNESLEVAGNIRVGANNSYKIGANTILTTGGNATNIFTGASAGNATATGNYNTFVGDHAGSSLTIGTSNTALGAYAGSANATGTDNVFVGVNAGANNSTGIWNTFIGTAAGLSTNASSNVMIGFGAGFSKTSGNNNVFLGVDSGRANLTGAGNVFLGFEAGRNETGSNRLYIDNSNTASPLIWGDFSSNYVNINGSLGLGTTTPASKLDVAGTAWLRGVAGGTSGLFVNSSGNVGIGTTNPGAKLEVNGTASIYYGANKGASPAPKLTISASGLNTALLRLDTDGIWNDHDLILGGFSQTSGTSSNQLVLKGSGNVGIGTTTPASKLDVAGTAWLRGVAGGTSGLFVNSSGNVGIGTTAPSAALDVNGNITIGSEGQITFNNGNATNLEKIITPATTGATDNAGFNFQLRGGNSSGFEALSIESYDTAASSLLQRMTVTGREDTAKIAFLNSNVGIGTTNPLYKLDVAGTTWLRGTSGGTSGLFVNSSGNVGIGTTSPGATLDVNGPTTGATPAIIRLNSADNVIRTVLRLQNAQVNAINDQFGLGLSFQSGTSGGAPDTFLGYIAAMRDGADNSGKLRFDTFNAGVQTTVMTLKASGNVGIGTTNPGYKLDVNGDINTTGDIRKNGAAYTNPDYVFEPNYDLMSISDLKTYVAENKHLPNVPSSEDVRRDGVKLFEQTRLNLEKTEEAYLYLFDLDSRVNALSQSLPTNALATNPDTEGLEEEIEEIKNRLLPLEERLALGEEEKMATVSATLADMKKDIELLKNTQTVASVSATLARSDLTVTDGEETLLEDLTVTGKTNLFNLAVLGKITTGLLTVDGLSCIDEENCKASISTLSGPLAIQEKASGPLEIMAGKITIDTNGDMKIDGKLTVGEVEAEKIKTKSVVLGEDAVFTSGTTPPSGACQTGTVYVFSDKEKDESRMFVCSKKSWQEVTTKTSVSNDVSPTPTISPTTSVTPTPSSIPVNSSPSTPPQSGTVPSPTGTGE